ncbi:MAG: class I SAM-dependent methyltransferase [Hyphomonadaceae bacterium]|nr:class I SAM-dependent methyltransferase [Hyphomonadaceae bacterium]
MTREGHKADWSNYWQGRTASDTGDALVGGVGIEHSSELTDFWSSVLGNVSVEAAILDLACGAGSVLRHAHRLGLKNLSGIDISEDAIIAMQQAIPGAKGLVGPVDQMPVADDQFDLVVSQFGFEYAGNKKDLLQTASEIARVLKKGGHLIAICHIKDGGIDREVSGHLIAIEELEATGFILASKQLFDTLFAAEANPNEATQAAFNIASEALSQPRQALETFIASNTGADEQIRQLGQHLLAGAADLYARRKAYALADITGWLGGMQNEIDAYKGRMTSMKNAALDEAMCASLLSVLEKSGYETEQPKPLHFGNEPDPAAWILKAG